MLTRAHLKTTTSPTCGLLRHRLQQLTQTTSECLRPLPGLKVGWGWSALIGCEHSTLYIYTNPSNHHTAPPTITHTAPSHPHGIPRHFSHITHCVCKPHPHRKCCCHTHCKAPQTFIETGPALMHCHDHKLATSPMLPQGLAHEPRSPSRFHSESGYSLGTRLDQSVVSEAAAINYRVGNAFQFHPPTSFLPLPGNSPPTRMAGLVRTASRLLGRAGVVTSVCVVSAGRALRRESNDTIRNSAGLVSSHSIVSMVNWLMRYSLSTNSQNGTPGTHCF